MSELFPIIAPVLLGVILGFLWGKRGLPYDSAFISNLVFNLGVPCLVFATLTRIDIEIGAFGIMAAAALVALAGFLGATFLLLKIFGLKQKTYLATVMTPNTGNVGLPLCLLAFGGEGLAFGIIVYSLVATTQFTFGLGMAAGTASPREFARIPLIYALAAALIFVLTGTKPPLWIANSTKLIGEMAIPLMVITLGVSLAKLKFVNAWTGLGLSVFRLAMGFGVGFAVAELFGLEGVARGVLILQSAMPAAIFNYMLAMQFDNEPGNVAGVVFISTVISFLTMPFLLSFVL